MRVDRVASPKRDLPLDNAVSKDFRISVKMAVLVNKHRDSTICKASHGHSCFNHTVTDQVQVLVRGGTPAEPAVVRNVHHQA